MNYPFPADVAALVHQHMSRGIYPSEDDLLRDALQALAQRVSDVEAIQAGINDLESGRVRPLEEVATEIRNRRQWTS